MSLRRAYEIAKDPFGIKPRVTSALLGRGFDTKTYRKSNDKSKMRNWIAPTAQAYEGGNNYNGKTQFPSATSKTTAPEKKTTSSGGLSPSTTTSGSYSTKSELKRAFKAGKIDWNTYKNQRKQFKNSQDNVGNDVKNINKSSEEGKRSAQADANKEREFYQNLLKMKMGDIEKDYNLSKTQIGNVWGNLKQQLEAQQKGTIAEYDNTLGNIKVQKAEQKDLFADTAKKMKEGLAQDQKKLLNIFAARGTIHSSEFKSAWADATSKFQDRLKGLNTDETRQMLKIDNTFNRYSQQKAAALDGYNAKINEATQNAALSMAKLQNQYQKNKNYTWMDYKKDRMSVDKALSQRLYNIDVDRNNAVNELKKTVLEQQKWRQQVANDLANLSLKERALDISQQRVNLSRYKAKNSDNGQMPAGYYKSMQDELDKARGEDGKVDPQIFQTLWNRELEKGSKYGNAFQSRFFNRNYLSENELGGLAKYSSGAKTSDFITALENYSNKKNQ